MMMMMCDQNKSHDTCSWDTGASSSTARNHQLVETFPIFWVIWMLFPAYYDGGGNDSSRKSMSLHIYFCHLAACVISFMIMIIFCRSSIDGSPCATNDRKNINKATQSNSSSVSVLCLMTLAWNPEKKHATYKAWRKKHDNKNIPAFPMCIFQDNSTTWILHFAWEGCCIEKLHIWVTNQLWVSQTRLSHRVTEQGSLILVYRGETSLLKTPYFQRIYKKKN